MQEWTRSRRVAVCSSKGVNATTHPDSVEVSQWHAFAEYAWRQRQTIA
jgi:hypothetical protein